ncbi:hypothetical protein CO613_06345 [Lysobacteraceae bacterium NML07-0707]|nr:hypothetical protein CO613_06345 [Xanthomonadaceae bacterium NML07-0707]
MKITADKYPIDAPRDLTVFAEKQAAFLGEAKQRAQRLAVLPEYLALELAAKFDAAVCGNLLTSLEAIQPLHARWMQFCQTLVVRLGMYINARTFPLDNGDGRYRNRSYLFVPDGGHLWQAQTVPDRFREENPSDCIR